MVCGWYFLCLSFASVYSLPTIKFAYLLYIYFIYHLKSRPSIPSAASESLLKRLQSVHLLTREAMSALNFGTIIVGWGKGPLSCQCPFLHNPFRWLPRSSWFEFGSEKEGYTWYHQVDLFTPDPRQLLGVKHFLPINCGGQPPITSLNGQQCSLRDVCAALIFGKGCTLTSSYQKKCSKPPPTNVRVVKQVKTEIIHI